MRNLAFLSASQPQFSHLLSELRSAWDSREGDAITSEDKPWCISVFTEILVLGLRLPANTVSAEPSAGRLSDRNDHGTWVGQAQGIRLVLRSESRFRLTPLKLQYPCYSVERQPGCSRQEPSRSIPGVGSQRVGEALDPPVLQYQRGNSSASREDVAELAWPEFLASCSFCCHGNRLAKLPSLCLTP